MKNKLLSIIVASYNDARIERAIRSIRRFDDGGVVKIVIVDGGSSDPIKASIRKHLSPDDVFISEKDRGIFDALNKGLDICDTAYIGWLGSDDMYTGKVLVSQVIAALENADLFIANTQFFRNGYVTRIMHALPSRLNLVKCGLHPPHYSTFGSAKLLKSERFRLGARGSDIEYFIRIFERKPRVVISNAVAVLQEEGGFSNNSVSAICRTNLELIPIYARYTNWFWAPAAVSVKLTYKILSRAYYAVLRTKLRARTVVTRTLSHEFDEQTAEVV